MPLKRYHLAETDSTNDVAKDHLRRVHTEHQFAVTADVQTHGRGRNGKTWHGSVAENVYCSVGLRHSIHTPSLKHLVSLQGLGCLAAKAALAEIAPHLRLMLKYPNDVYAAPQEESLHVLAPPRKICGVLVEHEFTGGQCVASVIGIGINVRQQHFNATFNAPELHHKATSLLMLGVEVLVEQVSQTLLRHLELLLKQPTDAVFASWREELALEEISLRLVGDTAWWQARELCEDGRLLIVSPTTGEERLIDNGDSLVVEWGKSHD